MTKNVMNSFQRFWDAYPADLSQKKKGVKSLAEKAWKKIPESKHEQIMTNMRELMRYCRKEKDADGKTDRWPFASTWLNQERWNTLEDIGTYTALNEKIAAKLCSGANCERPVEILDKCGKCYDKTNPHMVWLKEIHERIREEKGLNRLPSEGKQEHIQRLKGIYLRSR